MRKSILVAGMALLATVYAWGGKVREEPENQLDVYLEDRYGVNAPQLFRAQQMVTRMFADIGVRVQFPAGKPRPAAAAAGTGRSPRWHKEVVVRIAGRDSGAGELPAEALGYATPYAYSGLRIVIFYDQVVAMSRVAKNGPVAILAHVLAHEVTHVLQGVVRHSATGLMKAQWTRDELYQMQVQPMPLTPLDVMLMNLPSGRGGSETLVAAR